MLQVYAIALKLEYIDEQYILDLLGEEYLADVKKEMEKLPF